MHAPLVFPISESSSSEVKSVGLKRLDVIELLRGIAALAVCWFHFTLVYPETSWVRHTGTYGRMGVDVFFVVSGFIIPYAMARSKYVISDYYLFLRKRFWRLYPPYFICLFMIVLLDNLSALVPGFKGGAPDFSVFRIFSNLIYGADFFGGPWIGLVFWTLAIEVQYYIFIGLIYGNLKSNFLSILTISSLIILSLSIPLRGMIFIYLGFFALGVAVFLKEENIITEPVFIYLSVISFASVANNFGLVEACVAISTSILIRFNRFKVNNVFLFFGMISYSLYLIHVPLGGRIVNFGRRYFSGDLSFLSMSLVATAICLLAAWFFYKYIELPSQKKSSEIRYLPR